MTAQCVTAMVLRIARCALFLLPVAPLFSDAISDAQQRYQQGLAYERLGRLDQAYTELQLANTLDSSNGKIALALGVVASRLGRYDSAQRALEQSITVDANSVASYYHLGMIYESKGMKDRALDAWSRFVGLSQDETLKAIAQKHIRVLQNP